MFMLVTCY